MRAPVDPETGAHEKRDLAGPARTDGRAFNGAASDVEQASSETRRGTLRAFATLLTGPPAAGSLGFLKAEAEAEGYEDGAGDVTEFCR
jgi:hypothetical protein